MILGVIFIICSLCLQIITHGIFASISESHKKNKDISTGFALYLMLIFTSTLLAILGGIQFK